MCSLIVISFAGRPAIEDRTFSSSVIDQLIAAVKPLIKDPALAAVFENTLPNTLDTTVQYFDASLPDSFVITGDISALWLRDSTNQLVPYLPYISMDPNLDDLTRGLIRRHASSVRIDPFANAFNFNSTSGGRGHSN